MLVDIYPQVSYLEGNLLDEINQMFKTAVNDIINIFYPRLCVGCRRVLINQEIQLCTGCLYNLPKTNFHRDPENPMAQLFWGRVNIEAAAAFYYFESGSKCRKILHQIKYRGRKELAVYLGRIYGSELSRAGCFEATDILIPVPLHSSREKLRGFNQSERFASGLATSLKKEVMTDVLVRVSGTQTQTDKSRIDRWENVKNSFRVETPEKLENMHILLVDDVVTTGATLESCANMLLQYDGVSLSIVTIAYA